MVKLSRDAIVDAAFSVLADVGLAGLTARAVADRLDARPGALYYHVSDMSALRDEMATRIMRELAVKVSEEREAGATAVQAGPFEWENALRDVAGQLRKTLLNYRDGARLFSGTQLTEAAMIGSAEPLLAALTRGGIALTDSLRAVQTVSLFVTAYVIEEQHRKERPEVYRAEQREKNIDARRFPLTAAANDDFMVDPSEGFEWGMETIIAGVRARLPH